jgi:hypothetical protein
MNYEDFLSTKRFQAPAVGVEIYPDAIHPSLFGFQKALVTWAARKGRSAMFATTGMGKTRMQLEWARLMGVPTLILAPLAVAHQTVREAEAIDIELAYAHNKDEVRTEIVITNYERLHHFDPLDFGAVVLDESSILKAFDGKTRRHVIEFGRSIGLRLACTATPAPNDISEIANHAEFLGLMSRAEMLAAFFVHDDEWRLKGHAREAFFRWLASWGMSLTKPSDIGFPDDGYELPPLNVHLHLIETDVKPEGQLFRSELKGVTDRSRVRRQTLDERVRKTVELVQAEADEPWLVWTGLNDEADAVSKGIDTSINLQGSDDSDRKAEVLRGFADGEVQVLVSKIKIAGFGMNFQRCARMVFCGLSDSWEGYFQAIRRSWRFGQTRPVDVHVVLSDVEKPIFDNVMRKDIQAQELTRDLVANVAEYERAEMTGVIRTDLYPAETPLDLPSFLEVS